MNDQTSPSQASTYVNRDIPDVQAGYRKGRGTRDQIANIHWIIKTESSRKTSIFALLIMPKPLTVWVTTNSGKFCKRWKYQTTWPASEKPVSRSRNNSLNQTWNSRLLQIGKGVYQGCILPPYLFSFYPEKEESEKFGLKLNIQKMKIMASSPITSWKIDGETMETVTDFISGGLQNHHRWWLQPWK